MILDFHLVLVPSGDMVITQGPLFTRMFVTRQHSRAYEPIKYFVDSPGNIRRFPMTRAQAALLPALTRLIMFIFTADVVCNIQTTTGNSTFYISSKDISYKMTGVICHCSALISRPQAISYPPPPPSRLRRIRRREKLALAQT